jgi:hypothetical protein
VLRSVVFTALYGGGIVYFDLSPDILSVWTNVKNKTYKRKKEIV